MDLLELVSLQSPCPVILRKIWISFSPVCSKPTRRLGERWRVSILSRVAGFFLKGSWPSLHLSSSGSINWFTSGYCLREHRSLFQWFRLLSLDLFHYILLSKNFIDSLSLNYSGYCFDFTVHSGNQTHLVSGDWVLPLVPCHPGVSYPHFI